MKSLQAFYLTLTLALSATAQFGDQPGCPQIPPNDVEFGAPVPFRPQDIPSGCSTLEVLVARGTSEPNYAQGGKFGVIVGDPVISNLTKVLPEARGYPVQYPASADLSSGRVGSADVVRRLTAQNIACPNQKYALVGYSQGAAVMHTAAETIPIAIQRKVVAIVTFGDPYNRLSLLGQWPLRLRSQAITICAPGDPVSFNFLTVPYVLILMLTIVLQDVFRQWELHLLSSHVPQARVYRIGSGMDKL
ncbi:hypothetical protein VTL71DRAFT_2847 [Oculimacula yallundae]|uniref:Cutinase n=1 Tax=Oculimacula yallundae TaxID=86028 RepID=A0ABR4CAG8_9HELO